MKPALVDNEGNLLEGATEAISSCWTPGQHDAHHLWRPCALPGETYFSTFKGMYFTGDGARRDADGYYWITGRVDDVIRRRPPHGHGGG